jgi:diguanylate cyclase
VLVGLGCDELQGYLYARPMAPDDLLAWLPGRMPLPVALAA